MNKKLAWWWWLPLSAVSPLALAVGLGQATVNSPLQSPLDASVPLVDAADVALDSVRIEIAEPSAFDALGLEWTPLAASVRTELQRLPSGARLRLRSDQPVNDPWLDLLVTIITPDGRRTEALTLLFDPPNYAPAPASTAPSSLAASTPSFTPSQAAHSPVAATAPRDIAYVASGDTLWGVAERIKPADVSVQQMMMALLEANPAAFPTGNVDDIRAGQTLSVPSRAQLMARTPAQAAQSLQAMRQSPRAASAAELPSSETPDPAPPPEAAADVAAEASAPSAAQPEASAQAATVQEGELAGLTLNDLAEQLLESQAMLQTLLDEREAMRADMLALRQEVASLTEALNASQQETQRALAAAEARAVELQAASASGAAVAPRRDAASPGFMARLEQYQWPLASVALALLLGALVWARKRRERQWEEAPTPTAAGADVPPSGRAEPSVASAAASVPPEAQPVPADASLYTPPYTETEIETETKPSAPAVDEAAEVERSELPQAPSAASGGSPHNPQQDDATLAGGGVHDHGAKEEVSSSASEESHGVRYASLDDHDHDHDHDAFVETSALSEEDAAALESAFLDTPELVDEPVDEPGINDRGADATGTNDKGPYVTDIDATDIDPADIEAMDIESTDAHATNPSVAHDVEEDILPPARPASLQDEDRAHYIDYHPPSLSGGAAADQGGESRASESSSSQEGGASRASDEELEIEEVAFEPRRRDNG